MLEGYITPLLMSYISKYVKNIKPSDLQVSFWGGDAVLRNLELRLDVLEKELGYPMEFKSGHIREMTLHIPWNAIVSKPVEATIKEIEFVVKLKDVRLQSTQNPPSMSPQEEIDGNSTTPQSSSNGSNQQSSEQAPGYLQGYLNRITSNVRYHIQNLVIKVIEEECDMMLTLHFGSVESYASNEHWQKDFIYTDYFQGDYFTYTVLKVQDVVVNLQTLEGGQVDSSKEPFLKRCGFTCHTKSEYQSAVFARKTTNILFESAEFSIDEKQFCLFRHFIDWLLAMYYSSKRLKGRDDEISSSLTHSSQQVPDSESSIDSQGAHPVAATHEEQQQIPPSPESTQSSTEVQGWGAWAWSFVGSADATGSQSARVESSDKTAGSSIKPSSTFAIFCKSIAISFKVTHKVHVPVFYSVKSFTKPVLHVNFTGFMFQIDKMAATQLYGVSVGAMSLKAGITGLCPCVKKFPSRWRANATSMDATDQVGKLHNSFLGKLYTLFSIINYSYYSLTPPTFQLLPFSGFHFVQNCPK